MAERLDHGGIELVAGAPAQLLDGLNRVERPTVDTRSVIIE